MNERTNPAGNGTQRHPAGEPLATAADTAGNQVLVENAGPVGLAALVREAEALHQTLADAKRRAARLTAALRRQKKRDRLVATTLTALKELNIPGVGG
jgi:hypothetical protein